MKKENKKKIQKEYHESRQENKGCGMFLTEDERERKNKNAVRLFKTWGLIERLDVCGQN